MRLYPTLLLTLACLSGHPPAQARPDGNPNFAFFCSLGRHTVSVATERSRLVYRFKSRRGIEQTIVQDAPSANVFYRIQFWSTSAAQQLRFVNGPASYVVYNFFRAADYGGRGFADQSGLLVLRNGRVVARHKCKSGGRFDEDHQLDRLPADPLELPIP